MWWKLVPWKELLKLAKDYLSKDKPSIPEETKVPEQSVVEEKKEEMNFRKNITLITSDGHGATDPNTGEYHCLAGGKEYTFPDGKNVREGDVNRPIGKAIRIEAESRGYKSASVAHKYEDYSLSYRHKLTRSINGECCLVNIHNNASRGHNAKGFEVFTTRGETEADVMAEYIWFKVNLLKRVFPGLKMRSDMASDGDHDKEADFYETVQFEEYQRSIGHSGSHAYLEVGFFDHKENLELITNPQFIRLFARAVVDGVDLYYMQRNNK